MRAYLDLFFLNPEVVPEGLTSCEGDRGIHVSLKWVSHDIDHFENDITSNLIKGYDYYTQMGEVEEVWAELSFRTDRINPNFHMTREFIRCLMKMNASLDVNVYMED